MSGIPVDLGCLVFNKTLSVKVWEMMLFVANDLSDLADDLCQLGKRINSMTFIRSRAEGGGMEGFGIE